MVIFIKNNLKKLLIINNIIILIFTLHTKTLFADNKNEKINKDKITKIINLIDKNKWQNALKIAEKEKSDDLINLINWIRIFSPNDMKIKDLIDTYEKYQNWPKINYSRVLIEKKINWEKEEPNYYNFLNKHKPISALGKIKLYNYNFDTEKEEKKIIKTWVNNSFSMKDEIYIKKKYKNIFNINISIKRLNNLIWNKKWSSAYRELKEINTDHKNLFKAKIKLARKEYGVDSAINKVSENLLSDEGLVYERIKWRRKAKLKSSYDLLYQHLLNTDQIEFPKKWWTEIILHTRFLLNQKKYISAYDLLKNHKQTSSKNLSQAEWLLGWISLTHLSKTKQALRHFQIMEKNVNMPISIARANYWLGITEKKLNNIDIANQYFEKSAKYNTTYYGLLAEQILKQKKSISLIDKESIKIFYNNNTIFNSLRILSSANEKKYSTKFINGLFDIKLSEKEIDTILKIVIEEERPDLYIKICKKAVRIYNRYQGCLFPYPNNIKLNEANKYIDTALILAIMKQESEFYIKAKSRVGALGLMQIMPYTGKFTSKILNISYSKNKLIDDPNYNIMIGSKYFSELLKQFDNSIVLAIASYNAGPSNVKKWIKNFGDPRIDKITYINWIESIPFSETRNYVQRVLENYIVYQKVLLIESQKENKNINDLLKK